MSYRGSSVLRVPQDTILRLESAINGYSDGTVTFNIIDQKKRHFTLIFFLDIISDWRVSKLCLYHLVMILLSDNL